MSNFVHVTYATEDNYHLHRLLTSAEFWGIEMQVLGMNEPWQGFLDKIRAVHRLASTLPEDSILLFMDAYDAVYLQPEAVIERKFLAFDRPVVFSAEICFHAPGSETLAAHYPQSPTMYRYLNSGGFIGYAAPLTRIFSHILAVRDTDDDQSLLSRYFVEHQDEIALDYHTELFVNTSDRQYEEDFVITGGCLRNSLTGTEPCILHTPGKYYGVLEYYSRQLPFYRNIRWSRVCRRAIRQIVTGYLNLKLCRTLKRWGVVRNEEEYSRLFSEKTSKPDG